MDKSASEIIQCYEQVETRISNYHTTYLIDHYLSLFNKFIFPHCLLKYRRSINY